MSEFMSDLARSGKTEAKREVAKGIMAPAKVIHKAPGSGDDFPILDRAALLRDRELALESRGRPRHGRDLPGGGALQALRAEFTAGSVGHLGRRIAHE